MSVGACSHTCNLHARVGDRRCTGIVRELPEHGEWLVQHKSDHIIPVRLRIIAEYNPVSVPYLNDNPFRNRDRKMRNPKAFKKKKKHKGRKKEVEGEQ